MSRLPSFYDKSLYWKFVLPPKEELSLKLVFDNLENDAVSVGVLTAGYVYRRAGGPLWQVRTLLVLAVVLLLLNACQRFLLFLRMFHTFAGFTNRELYASTTKDEVIGVFKWGFLLAVTLAIPYFVWKLAALILGGRISL